MMVLKSIDISLVSGRRPDLLSKTLSSFSTRIFRHFDVSNFYANIDPIFGDKADEQACIDIIIEHFPRASINIPQTPSFGKAVSTLWRQGSERPLLHLEDDWIVLEDVTPESITDAFSPGVGMVAFAHKRRSPNEPDFGTRLSKIKLLGITVRRRLFNGWGTSPCFIRGGLSSRFGILINPELDPEKQVLHEKNPKLCRLQSSFKYRKIWRQDSGPLIEDIGREWREQRNIEKRLRGAKAYWVEPQT
jgi:hypothetical protein